MSQDQALLQLISAGIKKTQIPFFTMTTKNLSYGEVQALPAGFLTEKSTVLVCFTPQYKSIAELSLASRVQSELAGQLLNKKATELLPADIDDVMIELGNVILSSFVGEMANSLKEKWDLKPPQKVTDSHQSLSVIQSDGNEKLHWYKIPLSIGGALGGHVQFAAPERTVQSIQARLAMSP